MVSWATNGALRHEWWGNGSWHLGTLDGPGSPWPGHTNDIVGYSFNALVPVGTTQLHLFTQEYTKQDLRHDWFG